MDDVIGQIEQLVDNFGAAGVPAHACRPIADSLTMASDLLAWDWDRRRRGHGDLLDACGLNRLPGALGRVAAVCPELLDSSVERVAPPEDDALDSEAFALPPGIDAWAAGASFQLFQERMKSRLRAAGVGTDEAFEIVSAMNELASNADEHAEATVPPVIAWEVGPQRWCFCVTDVGRGVPSSLRTSAAYENLDDQAALAEALKDGVSRTSELGRGNGFRPLFQALADRNCKLKMRTGRVCATWAGRGVGVHTLTYRLMPERSGFHIEVAASLRTRIAPFR